jgi:hypothetical protein
LSSLPRRISLGENRRLISGAVDKEVNARAFAVSGKPRVVGGAFIGESLASDGGVNVEAVHIRENVAEHPLRLGWFDATVGHRMQIGNDKVNASISGIKRRRNCCGVCSPHE